MTLNAAFSHNEILLAHYTHHLHRNNCVFDFLHVVKLALRPDSLRQDRGTKREHIPLIDIDFLT